MQPLSDRQPVARFAPMSLLFARYVTGKIADPFWDQFMRVLDANETPMEERLALVAFLNDAFAELESGNPKTPEREEVRNLLPDVFIPPIQPT